MASLFQELASFRDELTYLPSSRYIELLCAEMCRAAFILNACLEKAGKRDGPTYHRLFSDWLESGLVTESQLKEWLHATFGRSSSILKHFDRARKQADRWCEESIWAAIVKSTIPHSNSAPGCPQVLFGKGKPQLSLPRVAIFNSRKPRVFSPDAEWLTMLRSLLPLIASQKKGVASSIGTITYDLVSASAFESGADLLLVVPSAMENANESAADRLLVEDFSNCTILTCLTRALRCPKAACMVCRDRIIAFFADYHCVLEISSGGNLLALLKEQQRLDPRIQRVFRAERKGSETEGGLELLKNFPGWARPFDKKDIGDLKPRTSKRAPGAVSMQTLQDVAWKDYLYHYTRACPGPWPGQSYRDYLLSLLVNNPPAGHGALDTLIRILSEGRIRAGSRIVRGDQAVVCWSAKSPLELESIRRWNPALLRWTFEPYGIAVKRSYLKQCGAKPSIYGKNDVYRRLKSSERYRFQRHEPPHCLWKHEREWRLPDDFQLNEAAIDKAFIFVPNRPDADGLSILPTLSMPLAVLSEIPTAALLLDQLRHQ
jgi:hypothetical protein